LVLESLQRLALSHNPNFLVDLSEIRKIVKLMDDHGLSVFQFEKEDFSIKLKKGADLEDLQRALASAPASPAVAAPAPVSYSAVDSSPPTESASGEAINSPMVGTFYRKSSPETPSFVNVGDSISEGQTLCIIEAMKVMNEIKAETSGTITEICIEDGNSVQFGDVLFRIK
jgi:acetyl-CoA carboxylase biotin carboxyl carrier protein